MGSSRAPLLLVALLLAAASVAGCGSQNGSTVASKRSSRSDRGQVVASVELTEPGDALRLYLHGWMLDYNERAPEEQPSASTVSWTPEEPDDFVSVMPVVSLTDFKTVTVWSATIHELGPVSEERAAYRADFMFWRGNPLSSAGTGAVPLNSSATYDLSWDEGRQAWAITQTSESPGDHLVESSREDAGSP
jgi:hypothetical protein